MSNELNCLSRLAAQGRYSRRDFLGRAAALGIGASAASLLLADAARAAGPVKGGTLKFALDGGASTDSLDPARIATAFTNAVGRSWGEELVKLSLNGAVEPLLATEWDSSRDAKVWTFKIRKGVQFHNGKTMTPDDVVATLERHSGPDTKSGALGIMRGIDSIKRDGDTVVLTLKQANADLPFLMTDFHLLVQPNGGKDAPNAGIGTGPYRGGGFDPGVRYLGSRFAGYWAASARGHAEQVEFLAMNDSTARTAALQSGRVNMMNRVDPKIVDLLKRAPGVTIHNTASKAHYCFAAHCNVAPFNNSDLRMALKLATNRQEMVDKILRGFGRVGNDSPISSTYPLSSADEFEQRTYDPEKAAFHYKKSGHSGPIVFRAAEVAFPGALDAAQLFQTSCAKAGIQIEVKREPNDGYWSNVWLKQPFCASFWNGRATQDQQYSTVYITGADWNETKFFNPKFDQMVVAARAELNSARRKAIYKDLNTIVRDEGGVIVPMFNDLVDGVGPKVGGYMKNPEAAMMAGRASAECWLEA